MPTLKGKWYFKEILTTANLDGGTMIIQEFNPYFEACSESDFSVSGSFLDMRVTCEAGDIILEYGWGGQESTSVWASTAGGVWYEPRCIDFGEAFQEVSEEFYKWFTKNAVDLQPTGTWRFNKTLKLPDHSIYTNYGPNAPYYTTCGYSNGVTIFEIGADSGSFYYNTGTCDRDSSLLELYYNNSWNVYDTNTEVYRNIEFVSGITLDPEFALWFYENVHSTELKLYSECYIAETADKIRECAHDNTLTFKVSDLADGVQIAYNAGYSQGTSEGGGSDTPTVTLTINRTGADATALLLTKIYYTTYEDGAFKQKTFSNLYSSGGSVTLSSIVREAHIVIDGGSGTMTSISSPMSLMLTPYIASSLLSGRVAILSINNDCPANVTLTING